MIVALGAQGHRGVVNIGGPKVLTPYDMAHTYKRFLGSTSVLVPCTRAEYSGATNRPRNAALDRSRLRSVLPQTMPRSITAASRAMFAPVVPCAQVEGSRDGVTPWAVRV